MQTPLSTPWPDWLAAARRAAPLDARLAELDVVVIGSGYGGSVAALRLAEQGRRVLVLERGSEFLPGEFPNHVGQLPKYLRGAGQRGPVGSLGGLFEVRSGAGMASIVANGLGGGSLINAGVLMRPDADVFAQPHWPAALRHASDTRGAGGVRAPLGLDAAFERAAGMLGGELFRDPGQPAGAVSALPKAQALVRVARALAKDKRLAEQTGPAATLDFEPRPARVTIALDACTRCGDCFSGCNVPGAKKTLATTYLGRAAAAGAQLVTRCLVYTLAPEPGGRGWALRVMATEHGQHARTLADVDALHGTTLRARTVVVAAGTFGSTELLMRSTRRAGGSFRLSPRLGQRLSGNGDGLSAIADLDPAPDGLGHGAQTLGAPAPVGPTITTVLDLRGHPSIAQRVVVQEGATPGAMVGLYREILASAWTLRHLGQPSRDPRGRSGREPLGATPEIARHAQMLLSMGHDGSAGEIVWKAERDAAVPCWTRPEEAATHRRQQQLFDAADRTSGGVHLHTPAWQVLPPRLAALLDAPVAPPTLLSVHPLGGCAMADSFEQGVVDHRGRVWRGRDQVWPDLLVIDGSIVPTSLGCNPLWTITALAERAMACLAAEPPDAVQPAALPAVPLPAPAPRVPLPVAREAAPGFDFSISERLENAELTLRGPLRRALGLDVVESDLRVYMRHPDFATLWDTAGHRLHDVEGRLRLVETVGELREHATPRRLEYRIAGGHVDLIARPPWWQELGPFCRILRTLRVGVTWWLLRGRRDWGRSEFKLDAAKAITLARLAWQAAELREVRYDLALALKRDQLPAGVRPPATLHLTGVKVIGYAASWTQIVRHVAVRWWQKRTVRFKDWCARLQGREPAAHPTGLGWDAPGRRHPADLRASLLHQLTEPMVRLDTARWHSLLPARLVGASKGRFAFDQQEGLQQSPARLHEGGDSSAAALALLAYPAFILRLLLQTRLLEFRLPDYSGKPVTDTASPADVALRVVLADGSGFCLAPDEIALHVRRGDSSSDDGDETDRLLHLRLWRYPRIDLHTGRPLAPEIDTQARWCGEPVRRARSVLLTHAFDMSGLAYTFKTTDRNFAEHLYAQGWEVWVLDSRMSPRTTASREPCTVDQLGTIDTPAAVDHILATLNRESHTDEDTAAPLQIFGFGQCMGAASFLIGLLAGRLSHRQVLAGVKFASATGERPVLPKLAGLVTSQTHPFVVGARDAQAKIWVPALLRDLDGRSLVPLSVRGPVDRDVEAMADRLFAGLPVPPGEHCHGEGERERHDDDDCVTCRRVRFLLGSMFSHRELNWATHRELPRLFGAGSVRLFAQGAKFFGYERLTSEDGFNVYATDAAIGRYLALPIRFMHGALNGLFDKESATRSASQYWRVHPGWAKAYGQPVDRPHPDNSGRRQRQFRVCDVIDGYGHLDVLIGQHAMQSPRGEPSTYARLGALLDQAWHTRDAAPSPLAEDEADAPQLEVRFPKAGPFFGPPIVEAGVRSVRLAFIVDDSGVEAPGRGHGGVVALVWHGAGRSQPTLVPLTLTELPVAIPARDRFVPCPVDPAIGLRIAHGNIPIPADGRAGPLRIKCVSYTPAMPGAGAAAAAERRALPSLDELRAAIARALRHASRQRRDADRPFPSTVSAQRRRPPNGSQRNALVAARLLDDPGPDGPVRIAIGCCRYGGFPIDRHRADASFRRLNADLQDGPRSADLLFMLGDQIYADRSAGLADPTSPTERFLHRHQAAFTTPALRRLMARLPTVCLPDDHEYVDGFPLGRPLVKPAADDPVGGRQRNDHARTVAAAAVSAYQLMQLPATAREQGWCAFERGGVRFFVLDTRSTRRPHRRGTVSTLSPAARKAFAAWVQAGEAGNALGCLVTASVVVPGLVPESNPAQAGVPDSMQAAPHERRWMLGLLVARMRGRFVLLAGDYHLSLAAALRRGDETVGAVILAPPFYAPLVYANCPPSDLWLGERIETPSGVLTLQLAPGAEPRAGSGHGVLDMQRRDGRWEVRLSTTLADPERGGGACERTWPAVRL